jgi:hypothetical protein
MKPFLDCYLFCINTVNGKNYIRSIIKYNSLTTDINYRFDSGNTLVPDFEVSGVSKLKNIDLDVCEDNNIEIIRRNNDRWEIYLDNYEKHINS